MALSPGYILENVHNRNWAIITNDNDGDDVISGTDADEDAGYRVEYFSVLLVFDVTYYFFGHTVGSQKTL
jgi:hypothetical protein